MVITEEERRWDGLFRALGAVKGEVRAILSDPQNDAPLLLQHASQRADQLIRTFWEENHEQLLALDDGLLDEMIDLVRVRYQTYRAALEDAIGGVASEDAEIAAIRAELGDPDADLEAIRGRLLDLRGVVGAARRWELAWEDYLDRRNGAIWAQESIDRA